MEPENQQPLWTKNYIFACIGNFLLYFGFFAAIPILPIFLIEKYGIPQSHTGLILAAYTFSALVARPISAYFSDLYSRKILYCSLFLINSILFLPYPFLQGVALFVLLRIIHGFAFGGLSVCGNAFVIDIMPENRRGEGFGYFGITNSLGFALGAMGGFFVYELTGNFLWVFLSTFFFSILGLFFILGVHLPPEKKKIVRTTENTKLTFDKLYQTKGIFAGIALFMISSPYGLITSFAAIYGKELGITGGIGAFFAFQAAGLILSRVMSGKLVDKGKTTRVIIFGSFMVTVVLAAFGAIGFLHTENMNLMRILFYLSAFFLGFAYGILFPAYNLLFVNLAPDNRRAAASSTYLTNWDVGLGAGLILGGIVMENYSMAMAYLFGAVSAFLSAIYFTVFVAANYNKNKLR